MTIHTLLAEEITNTLINASEYELGRNRTKYEKLATSQGKTLAKLEAEERALKSNAYDVLDNPEALTHLRQSISSKGLEIELVKNDIFAYDDVLSFIDKALDVIVSKKNNEQILKYLKSLGYTTLEQVKAALSKNH